MVALGRFVRNAEPLLDRALVDGVTCAAELDFPAQKRFSYDGSRMH